MADLSAHDRGGSVFGVRVAPGDRALVIAPHPDDETLGAGGTIATLAAAGVAVEVLAVACPAMSMHGGASDPVQRRAEFNAACQVLGVRSQRIAWSGPEVTLGEHRMGELVALIEGALATCDPHVLLLPEEGHHHDHRALHLAGLAALRPGHREDRPLPRLVLGYDGPEDRLHLNGGLARPLLVDVSAQHELKLKALGCYTSQLRPAPHPRSIEITAALDQVRGAVLGVAAAEAFTVLRAVL